MWSVNTELTSLPFGVFRDVGREIQQSEPWEVLHSAVLESGLMRKEDWERVEADERRGEALLQRLSRTLDVKGFIKLLHSARLLRPQLLLHRKFQPVQTSTVRRQKEEGGLRLSCLSKGFPYPCFEWLRDEEAVGTGPSLLVPLCPRCSAARPATFQCRVWNAVPEADSVFPHYSGAGSGTFSEARTDAVRIDPAEECSEPCRECREVAVEAKVRAALEEEAPELPDTAAWEAEEEGECVASDKVALIISNAEYAHLPALLTPPCDAAVLAEGLLAQGFKTVTLANLDLEAMRRMVREYRALLGEGVYAVFYFVGHGLEAGGRCYLLPVDTPGREYSPDHCVSVEWLRAQMQGTAPALNLILLDMCRKFPPHNLQEFIDAGLGEPTVPANRNSVLGFATSAGVGAYEVRGQVNGVFMKYLKEYLALDKPVFDILQRVNRDLELDPKASEVQFPEVRSCLSRPRKLTDPIRATGHTASFDHRSLQWQLIHQLPDPLSVHVPEFPGLRILVWFDYFGHFTNMCYAFTSVVEAPEAEEGEEEGRGEGKAGPSQAESLTSARGLRATLLFPAELSVSAPTECTDQEEGVSLRYLLKGLHRFAHTLPATLHLRQGHLTLASHCLTLGPLLITQLPPTHTQQQTEPLSHSTLPAQLSSQPS